ncbi:MAG: AsmA family protein [Terricaulis sp.]
MTFNLRTLGLGLAALLGVLVLALVLFFVFFPKDLAAREAERRIEEATGRDLVLGGDIQLSFWPALGFSVEQASLSNPEGFDAAEHFIAADRIVFAVAVLPLLSGNVEVKQLIFEQAQLRLQAEEDGAVNWTFPTEANTPEQQTTLEDLRLDDVRLVDSLISFQGAGGGAPMMLEHVDASLALESLDAPAELEAAFDYRGERLNVTSTIGLPRAVLEKGETPLTANIASDPLTATLDGVFNAATGALSGRLQANGASVRQLLAWFGSPIGEGGGFGAFRLDAQMAHAGEETALTDASIRLDTIDARGALTLINQENGRLRVNGALSSANVDLNTYLPAPTQGAAAGGVEVDTAWSAAPLDLSGLRALDANIDLTLGALKFQRMSFTDVALGLRIANGAADARLTRISLYEGGGTARLIADGSGATARVAVEIDARNIQAETLLRDAIGFDKIVGRGRLTASLVGQGASQAAIMRSLSGNAAFNFNDGQWKGVNLAQVARTVQSALTGAAAGESGATDFAELAATLQVAGGVAATQDMRMLNPFVRLEGTGLIDIGGQSIDMRIAPRAVRSAQGQGGDLGVAGLGVPFRVSGPWAHVRFAPALGDVVQNELRARAQNVLRNQPAGSPLATLGDALFGRTPAVEPPAATPTTPEGGAAPATTPPAEEPRRNPLEDILRRATRPTPPAEPTPPAPAPAPTP